MTSPCRRPSTLPCTTTCSACSRCLRGSALIQLGLWTELQPSDVSTLFKDCTTSETRAARPLLGSAGVALPVLPGLASGLQELTEATTHGHVDVVEFLLRIWILHESELNRLLVTAAANGRVPVVRVFRRITVGGLPRTGKSFYIESTFRSVAATLSADTMRAVLKRCQLPETLGCRCRKQQH